MQDDDDDDDVHFPTWNTFLFKQHFHQIMSVLIKKE